MVKWFAVQSFQRYDFNLPDTTNRALQDGMLIEMMEEHRLNKTDKYQLMYIQTVRNVEVFISECSGLIGPITISGERDINPIVVYKVKPKG
jgi:hypothetical protein